MRARPSSSYSIRLWNDGLAKIRACPFYDLVVTINPVVEVRRPRIPSPATLGTVPGHHVVAWRGAAERTWPETYDAYDTTRQNPGEDS